MTQISTPRKNIEKDIYFTYKQLREILISTQILFWRGHMSFLREPKP